MIDSICSSNAQEWSDKGLLDFSDFSDKITEINQRDLGDCTAGEWFYADEEKGVIYGGSFGNDNSPGASSYTHGEIFDLNDPEDLAAFNARKAELEAMPEWLESEEDDEDEGDDE